MKASTRHGLYRWGRRSISTPHTTAQTRKPQH